MTDQEREQYVEAFEELSGNNFLKVHFKICRELKGDGSTILVLAYLLNQLYLKNQNPSDRKLLEKSGYWMRCPAKSMEEKLGMTRPKRNRSIQKLTVAKVIKVKHGKGFIQWVHIRNDWMQRLRNVTARGNETLPQRLRNVTPIYTKKPKKKLKREKPSASRNGSPHPESDLFSTGSSDGFPRKAEKRFREAHRLSNRPLTDYSSRKGAESVAGLVDKVGQARVLRLIDWYSENLGAISKPRLTSVHQFCKLSVFQWLEDQMFEHLGIKRVAEKVDRVVREDLGNGRSRSYVKTEYVEKEVNGHYVEGKGGRKYWREGK